MRTDVHQHLWTEPLLAALEARSERPRLRREGGSLLLQIDGEPDSAVDRAAADPLARARLVQEDGLDLALVAPSSPIGIEALPPAQSAPLLDAYSEGARELPPSFAAWAAVGVAQPDPAEVDARLRAGFAGVCLPAGALGDAAGIERCAPLLECLERHDAPLLIHPGRGAADGAERGSGDAPAWWPALTGYVAQMNAAWHAFVAFGTGVFRSLRVVFAMLAGLAPLQLERLRARGGPADDALGANLFYDTSSYGPRAVDAMIRCVGIDQIVYGSDRPVVVPASWSFGHAARHAVFDANPARLLGGRSNRRPERPM